jgi:hypothetical protein
MRGIHRPVAAASLGFLALVMLGCTTAAQPSGTVPVSTPAGATATPGPAITEEPTAAPSEAPTPSAEPIQSPEPAPSGSPSASPTGDPSAVVQSFYDWWIANYGSSASYEDRPELSPAFIQEVMDGAPYPLDRFMCAQAFAEAVEAGEATIDGDTAVVPLYQTYGTGPGSSQQTVDIGLTFGPAGWQITSVDCTNPRPGGPPDAEPPAGTAYLGTDTVLFVDEFERRRSGWTEGDMMGNSLFYGDGRYNMYSTAEFGVTGTRALDRTSGTVRFAADMAPQDGDAATMGVACVGQSSFITGTVTSDGSYSLTRSDLDGEEVLEQVDDPPLEGTGPGSTFTLTIECGVHADGGTAVYLSMNDTLLLEVEVDPPTDVFTQVGIALEGDASLFVERAAASVTEADR